MQLLCGIPPMQAVAAGEAAMCADDYVRAVQLFTAALHSGVSGSDSAIQDIAGRALHLRCACHAATGDWLSVLEDATACLQRHSDDEDGTAFMATALLRLELVRGGIGDCTISGCRCADVPGSCDVWWTVRRSGAGLPGRSCAGRRSSGTAWFGRRGCCAEEY